MISISKTAVIVGVLLAQLSSAAVLHQPGRRQGPFHGAHTHAVWKHPGATATATVPANFAYSANPPPSTSPPLPPAGEGDDADDDDGHDDDDHDDDPNDDPDDPSVAPEPVSLPPSPAPAYSAAPVATTTSTGAPATTRSADALWQPAAGTSWQIELLGIVTDTSYEADVWDLDLFDVPQATIDGLHAAGKKVICYFSAGSFEDWRADVGDFAAADLGLAMDGWPGEWWLDTRSANVRAIMTQRIALAKTKQCDGLDPDNVDGFGNANGLGLTAADSTAYLNFLADTAHAHGLAIGLKNSAALVDDLVGKMQFLVNEQCLVYDECHRFAPFIEAGKPVFHIEYPEMAEDSLVAAVSSIVKNEKCVASNTTGFSTVLKKTTLDSWVDAC